MMCANTVRLLPPRAREVVSNRANQRNVFFEKTQWGPFCGHMPHNGPHFKMEI